MIRQVAVTIARWGDSTKDHLYSVRYRQRHWWWTWSSWISVESECGQHVWNYTAARQLADQATMDGAIIRMRYKEGFVPWEVAIPIAELEQESQES